MRIRAGVDRCTELTYPMLPASRACFNFLALSSEKSGRPSTTHSGAIKPRLSQFRVVFSETSRIRANPLRPQTLLRISHPRWDLTIAH